MRRTTMLNAESVAKLSELDAPLLTAYLNRQPSEPSRHQLHPETLAWMKRHGRALVEKVSPSIGSLKWSDTRVSRVWPVRPCRRPHLFRLSPGAAIRGPAPNNIGFGLRP